jgi:hypothetical protein
MIVAINCDPNAPFFNVGHFSIVGDIFQVVPDSLPHACKKVVILVEVLVFVQDHAVRDVDLPYPGRVA